MCTESRVGVVRSIYNLQLYAPGHNPGGYIECQSCFLTAVVGGRLVSRQTVVLLYYNIVNK